MIKYIASANHDLFRIIEKVLAILSLILIQLLSFPLFSQQLEIRYCGGTGSFMTFSEWKGYSVAWNQLFKSGTKIGISFNHSFKTKPYSWVHTSIDYENATEKIYIENRDPDNQHFEAEAFVGWCPLRSQNAAIYLGPTTSLNWMRIHEKTHRYANQWFVDAVYYNLHSKKNRFGVGIFVEFEIYHIFTERLSASMRLHSSMNGYGGIGSWNRAEPDVISWLGADIGLKWNFGKAKTDDGL